MMEQIRSFVAIELPQDVKRALASLEEKLKASGGAPVKWVEPESIHLTLKFLGDIESGAAGGITAALKEAARGTRPFSIAVSGLGVFPDTRRVRVVWVGLTGDLDILAGLQKRVEAALVPLGFPAEGRAFTPHLTIARVRDYAAPDARQALGQLISKTSFGASHEIKVSGFSLMRSQLTREGPVYTRLSTIGLQ
ncbi:MAG: RNA 2',3'-cyclic phosphodiesterase [Dehalococcoidales bacterium]|jgi:2'-5' RNA ligase